MLALPAQSANRLQPVPILMYHVVTHARPRTRRTRSSTCRGRTSRRRSAWLAAHGYHAVTLQRVFDSWRGAAQLPAKPIVLSFDDGYLSQVRNALPLLKARHWPGVLNLEVAEPRSRCGGSGRRASGSCSPPAGSSTRTRSRIPT